MMKLKEPPPQPPQNLPPSSPIIKQEEIKKERLFSTSSTSMNEEDDDDDEGMSDVDEEASALEQMMVSKQSIKIEPTTTNSSSIKMESVMSPQKVQKETKKSTISPTKTKKSILHEDLELSESSSGDDEIKNYFSGH
ncbi:EAF domain-containing protein [Meloidogyne graminicola]|uniref:EAF domain-containing protein n=1 Tax=Meloidogyne graminicola TaxID=189291 RepID=A0A8T0A285_9BILA|nr:EAF domain-containing protein [Meloidogyne graminicola]